MEQHIRTCFPLPRQPAAQDGKWLTLHRNLFQVVCVLLVLVSGRRAPRGGVKRGTGGRAGEGQEGRGEEGEEGRYRKERGVREERGWRDV